MALTEQEKIAHLLRRFGLGASEAEREFYGNLGWRGTIEYLLASPAKPDRWDVRAEEFANDRNVVNIRAAQGIWYGRMCVTDRPFVEKMTLFWHNHFATSASKVTSSYAMMSHIDTLREKGFGKFEDLLVAVSEDPAMLFWLDNQLNVAGKPNENFARELMELFTIGIGNYTETDVKEAARAFTGWGFGFGRNPQALPRRMQRFRIDQSKHDRGTKTVLGITGNLDGYDVIKLLCNHPRTAQFIAEKAWKFFAVDQPPAAAVARSEQAFRESGLSIPVLVRSIMESEEFYSPAVVKRQVKNPIDYTVSTARQLGAGNVIWEQIARSRGVKTEGTATPGMTRALAVPLALRLSTKAMGMELMWPPDVSGWGTGTYWVSSATIVARLAWNEAIFAPGQPLVRPNSANRPPARTNRQPRLNVQAWPLLQDDPSLDGVVNRILSLFDCQVDGPTMDTLREGVRSATNGGPVTTRNANAVASKVCTLLAATPAFQMH